MEGLKDSPTLVAHLPSSSPLSIIPRPHPSAAFRFSTLLSAYQAWHRVRRDPGLTSCWSSTWEVPHEGRNFHTVTEATWRHMGAVHHIKLRPLKQEVFDWGPIEVLHLDVSMGNAMDAFEQTLWTSIKWFQPTQMYTNG